MSNFLLSPPRRRKNLDPVDYGKSFGKLINMDLSRDEQKAVEALRKVTHDSVYGEMIRDAFIDESPEKFRQLFGDILSQMADKRSSGTIYQIIGKEAYDSLIAIKPSL